MASLTSALGSFAVSFLVSFLQGWLSDMRAASTLRESGKLAAERDQAIAGNKAKGAELDALANAPKTMDDALERLDRGDA
jgi:hypothetical protein